MSLHQRRHNVRCNQRPPMLVGSTRTLSSQRRSILGTPTPAASATALRATAGTSLLDFVSWAIKREIQFSSVRPEGEDGSRRVVATGRVSPGAVLVSVPEATALTVRPSERCPFHDGVLSQQAWSSLPWFAQLALKLLLQTAQGAASSYATYLAVLPTASVPLLALWSDQQLHQLHYPALAAKARQDREIWTQAVETARPALTALRCSDDDLLWALALVRSRSFAAPCFPTPASVKLAAAGALQVAAACLAVGSGDAAAALPPLELLALGAPLAWLLWELRVASTVTQYSVCPFIDFFNHSSDSKSECSFDFLSSSFKVAASADASPGQEVFISYGSDLDADQLLRLYGFVEARRPADQRNPLDSYVIQDFGTKVTSCLQGRFSSSSNAAAAGLPAEVAVYPSGFTPEVVAAVQQLLATASASASAGAAPDDAAAASGRQLALHVLADVIDAELASLPTTLAQDVTEISLQVGGSLSSGCRPDAAATVSLMTAVASPTTDGGGVSASENESSQLAEGQVAAVTGVDTAVKERAATTAAVRQQPAVASSVSSPGASSPAAAAAAATTIAAATAAAAAVVTAPDGDSAYSRSVAAPEAPAAPSPGPDGSTADDAHVSEQSSSGGSGRSTDVAGSEATAGEERRPPLAKAMPLPRALDDQAVALLALNFRREKKQMLEDAAKKCRR